MLSTVCYIEKNEKYLMLHRTKKEKDINKEKWIGIGGKFEKDESPEECILREVKEETNLELKEIKLRAVVTFVSDKYETEYMYVFTSKFFEGELEKDCNEGELEWIDKTKVLDLNIWEGDKIFLREIDNSNNFFTLKLCYEGDNLIGYLINRY